MPCYDSRNSEEYWEHNSTVAGHLCEAFKLLAQHGLEQNMSFQAREWWLEHQQRDANRRGTK